MWQLTLGLVEPADTGWPLDVLWHCQPFTLSLLQRQICSGVVVLLLTGSLLLRIFAVLYLLSISLVCDSWLANPVSFSLPFPPVAVPFPSLLLHRGGGLCCRCWLNRDGWRLPSSLGCTFLCADNLWFYGQSKLFQRWETDLLQSHLAGVYVSFGSAGHTSPKEAWDWLCHMYMLTCVNLQVCSGKSPHEDAVIF